MVTIAHFPEEPLVDEEMEIRVHGLQPWQDITVYASLRGDGSDVFESYAHYQADANGNVDFSRASSKGGSYLGIERMGLFWGMKPSTNNVRPHSRLVVRNVQLPVEVEMAIYDSHLKQEQLKNRVSLAQKIIRRWYKGRRVARVPVRKGRLRGTLFIPEGSGPFPAIVDLFGTAGGLMEFRSALLASRGFLTLALAFFGFEDLPSTAFDVDLSYFEEARMFLAQHPKASPYGVGIIGVSVGGTLALTVATYVKGFSCAVSINGPVFAQYSTMEYRGRIWRAKPVNLNRAHVENNALVLASCLDDHWGQDLEDSEIEFCKCHSSFLFIFSEDDKAINTERAAELVHDMFRGVKGDYQVLTYGGAGHLLEPPFSPHFAVTHTKLLNMPQNWGGNSKQHSIAQVKAWSDMMMFLRKRLIPKPSL